MKKKLKIGVLGVYRGTSMINYCKAADNADVVAICDKWEQGLEKKKKELKDDSIAYYSNFEDFIKHDMDAVVLANYATEHAPFAIRCMNEGKHVFSEVLPVQTLKEAVELIEKVEKTGMVYAYGENYCYMPATYEMKRLYKEGTLGEFEYGEGEYIHNCESGWPSLTYGDPGHWRNNMYATFYCTHSIGPIIHITGLRPVSVIGFEGTKIERNLRTGCKGGSLGIEMITLENGGKIKSIHGGLYKDSIWYTIYGSKGRMESAREDTKEGDISKIYVNADEFDGQYINDVKAYKPVREFDGIAAEFGHGNSDFYTMYNFIEKILGNKDADMIDIYEALDMFLPGMFAYRSVLNGNIPMLIPNLRDKAVRDKFREDTMCTDRRIAKDMYVPPFSKGEVEIPEKVYEKMRNKWLEELNN